MSLDLLSEWYEYLPDLARGVWVSLKLVGASLVLGLPLGLLLGVLSASPIWIVSRLSIVLVETGRAVPAVVLLQLAYYGLPSVNLTLSSFVAATAGLAWLTAAYSSEVFRAGVQAVPHGQKEASEALGLTSADTYRFIIIPQAFRIALPSLLGLSIQVFQVTALAFTIALPELLSEAYNIGYTNFRFLSVLTLAGLIYVAIVIPASGIVQAVERRLSRHIPSETG